MKKNDMICYCGHDCSRCVTYLATVKDDDTLRSRAQKFYKTVFGHNFSAEMIRCHGGRTDKKFCLCEECPFATCCKERGIEACSECDCFPCKMLDDYLVRYVNKVNQITDD